jgi:AAA domain
VEQQKTSTSIANEGVGCNELREPSWAKCSKEAGRTADQSRGEVVPLRRSTAVAGQKKGKFRLLSLEELSQFPKPEWQIEGILPRASFAELYGKDKSGKSFIALDWGLSIATGQPWLRHPTQLGSVVYVAAEGKTGIWSRIRAWLREHGIENNLALPFHVVDRSVHMLNEGEVDELIAAIRDVNPNPTLIVLDTLARNFGDGDENSTKDMNTFVGGCDRLREAFGDVTVLVVHHSGKAQKSGDRGSTVLRGAVDTRMELTRHETKERKKTDRLTLTCQAQKDAAEFEPIRLRLACRREDDSCIIEPRHGSVEDEGWDDEDSDLKVEKYFGVLRSLDAFGGEGATYGDWQKASGKEKPNFNYARKRLVEEVLVEKAGNRYKVTSLARDLLSTQRSAEHAAGQIGRKRSKSDQPLAA